MAPSLGLAAYRALTRRSETPDTALLKPRPKGELVWLHAAEPGSLLAVRDLALRLIAARVGLQVLISLPDGVDMTPLRGESGLLPVAAPSEHPDAVARFLDHWAPDMGVWLWGALRPNLVLSAAELGCPLMLIDAESDGFDKRRLRWLPDLTRQMLSRFDTVLARSEAGRKRLLQLGSAPDRVELTSPLLAGGQPLGCSDADLTDLAATMGGRPAWFAAQVMATEIPIVLAAHQRAARLSHRLLLIVEPAQAEDAPRVQQQAAEQNLNAIRWHEGQYPDDTTQVLISEDRADQGLFFRVAPVSFLGSTLFAGDGGCDPLNAAALGSAILYGPKVRRFVASYSRLASEGAARIVNDSDALATAVSTLIAPDQAAAMAHAGWDVISRGAALTDRVVDHVQEVLDRRAGAA